MQYCRKGGIDMTREKFGVLLDAKDKLCGSCDAVYCDTCYVPKLVEKHKNLVVKSENRNLTTEGAYITIISDILRITSYFNMMDLYIAFEKKGIDNRGMINRIVDDLTESGKLRYLEIKENLWGFEVVRE